MRREKEKKLKQHFAHHMSELRQVEKLSIIESEKKEIKNKKGKNKEIMDDNSFLTSINDDYSYINSMDSVHSYNTNSNNTNNTHSTTTTTTTNKGKRVNILTNTPTLTLSNDHNNIPIITAMSPKARLLMTKPLQRTTSFMIDSVPTDLKSPKSESSKHIQANSNASIHSGSNSIHSGSNSNLSTAYNSPSNLNNVHLMSPSSRIKSYTNNINFDYSTTNNTNTKTNTTTSTTTAAATTTTPKHRNAVTFNFDTKNNTTANQTEEFLSMDKSIMSPYTAKLNNTANLVTQSIAALPDYQIQKQKERNIHLNPKRLLLDNTKSMHLYDQLSDGEKVLALHKTFHHIGDLVNVSSMGFIVFFLVKYMGFIVFFDIEYGFYCAFLVVYMGFIVFFNIVYGFYCDYLI